MIRHFCDVCHAELSGSFESERVYPNGVYSAVCGEVRMFLRGTRVPAALCRTCFKKAMASLRSDDEIGK